jgi:hypothetical protein
MHTPAHTSAHTSTVIKLADLTPACASDARKLAATVLDALKSIEAHASSVRDALALAMLDETHEATAGQLSRLPPFVTGVVTEIAVLRASATRLATIAKELSDIIPSVASGTSH